MMLTLYKMLNRFLSHRMILKAKVIMLLLGIASIALIIFNMCGILNICVTDDNEILLPNGSDQQGRVKDKDGQFNDYDLAETDRKAKKVNVTVFYEVLCPDSRHFILRQLFPTWEKVSDIMELDYRPFGKADYKKRPGGGYKFSCQHGPTECLGNIVHNCVIKYVPDPLPYIKCMMEDNYEPLVIGRKCAYHLELDWEPISKCAQGREGEELMAVVAQESLGVKHKLSFIPTVALDGDYSNQNNILKNFLPVLCNKYKGERPQNCVQVI